MRKSEELSQDEIQPVIIFNFSSRASLRPSNHLYIEVSFIKLLRLNLPISKRGIFFFFELGLLNARLIINVLFSLICSTDIA